MNVMESLLATSTAIGTDVNVMNGDEVVVWRTSEGVEFTTSYEDALAYGPTKEKDA